MTVRIETDRLLLRLPRLDDAEGAAEYLTDPDVMHYIGGETVAREDAPGEVQKWLDHWAANGFGSFSIERREDERFLGRAAITVWDTRGWRHATLAEAGVHAQPELGWVLASSHWGNGYATEAALAVRDWGRRERGIERLISLIHPENVGSQRVAQRLNARPGDVVTLFESRPAVIWVHPR